MSQVADQVLYQARRVTGKVADISNNLMVLQQAGVGSLRASLMLAPPVDYCHAQFAGHILLCSQQYLSRGDASFCSEAGNARLVHRLAKPQVQTNSTHQAR